MKNFIKMLKYNMRGDLAITAKLHFILMNIGMISLLIFTTYQTFDGILNGGDILFLFNVIAVILFYWYELKKYRYESERLNNENNKK